MDWGIHHQIGTEINLLTYRKASLEDALSLSTRLRECDSQELEYSTGEATAVSLEKSWRCSEECEVAVEASGKVIAIWGISRVSEHIGVPWMVGSVELARYSKRLIAHARPWVEKQSKRFACLANFVYAGNHTSIRWLEALGFTIGTAAPFGVAQQPFHKFYKTNV
jgi:hypothetical protein